MSVQTKDWPLVLLFWFHSHFNVQTRDDCTQRDLWQGGRLVPLLPIRTFDIFGTLTDALSTLRLLCGYFSLGGHAAGMFSGRVTQPRRILGCSLWPFDSIERTSIKQHDRT